MKIGAIFPQDIASDDSCAVRAYAAAVEAMGFSHIVSYDHVIGANPASRPGWQGYDLESRFHEPVSLLSFIAGVTTRIGLATGVMILLQRQTVLVVKQAATLDLLSGGRLRLGVGTGWNTVEYEALGASFKERGKVFDEQIDVLRALWSERAVTLATPYHTITDAGLFPMPRQRPIPLWLGGGGVHPIKGWANVDPVIRRIASKADGWMPTFNPDGTGAELVERFRGYCWECGRDPAAIGIDALLPGMQAVDWAEHTAAWARLGATHMSCGTGGAANGKAGVDGISGVDQHLRRLEEIKAALVAAGIWRD